MAIYDLNELVRNQINDKKKILEDNYFSVLLRFLLKTDICCRLKSGETISWRGASGLYAIAGRQPLNLQKSVAKKFWKNFADAFGLVLNSKGLHYF